MSYILAELGGPTTDYRIEPDGLIVALLSDRSISRGVGQRPRIGSRLAFRTKTSLAEFVLSSEAEGFTFDGKEHLSGAWPASPSPSLRPK